MWAIISFLYGHFISVKDILSFTDSLLTVASIIFGIVGAWLAVIWQNITTSKNAINYLKNTILFAFIVIVFSLLSKFSYPILKQIYFINKIFGILWIRRIFIFISGIAMLLLFFSLLFSLLSFDFFAFEEDMKKQQKERLNRQKGISSNEGQYDKDNGGL
jgi:hypothetical protein